MPVLDFNIPIHIIEIMCVFNFFRKKKQIFAFFVSLFLLVSLFAENFSPLLSQTSDNEDILSTQEDSIIHNDLTTTPPPHITTYTNK